MSAGRFRRCSFLIPERILQTRRCERAVGLRFRARLVRNLLVNEAGRRRNQFFILPRVRIIGIFGFHWGDTSISYDLHSLNTSKPRPEAAKFGCLLSKNPQTTFFSINRLGRPDRAEICASIYAGQSASKSLPRTD